MTGTIVAVLGLVLLFVVYGVLTLGKKHRGCTRCLDDESAPRCDTCPLSRLEALRRREPDDPVDREGSGSLPGRVSE